MKSKKKAKAKTKSKSKTHRRTSPHVRIEAKTSPLTTVENTARPDLAVTAPIKTCQEVEVGDIGGFGSPAELEQHEKRCSEPAAEFCGHCGKNLCRNHYDLLHRVHDTTSGHATGPSIV